MTQFDEDKEFADTVLAYLHATGLECHHYMDGDIRLRTSIRVERNRRKAHKTVAMSAAEEKRARKAAKLAQQAQKGAIK